MKKQVTPKGKFSIKTELSRSELKQVLGSSGNQTYCDGLGPYGSGGPFPVAGSMQIGCFPAYCHNAHHGEFLYCA